MLYGNLSWVVYTAYIFIFLTSLSLFSIQWCQLITPTPFPATQHPSLTTDTMRTYYFLPLLAPLLAAAAPQAPPFSSLPQCAQNAALASISASGCQTTDAHCICSSSAYITTLQNEVKQNCDAADANGQSPPKPSFLLDENNTNTTPAALTFGQQTCAAAGVPLAIGSNDPTSTTTVPGATTTSTIPISSVSWPSTGSMTWPTMTAMNTSCPSNMPNATGVIPAIWTGAAAVAEIRVGAVVVAAAGLAALL